MTIKHCRHGVPGLDWDPPAAVLRAMDYLEGDAEAAEFMARRFFEQDVDARFRDIGCDSGPRRTLGLAFVALGSVRDYDTSKRFRAFKTRIIGVYDFGAVGGNLPDTWMNVNEWRLGKI